MPRVQVWPIVHAERHALIRDLSDLPDEQWTTPSLCDGWDVHDVLAHIVDSAKCTRRSFVWRMLKSRMDFDADNADGIQREKRSTPHETLNSLRAAAELKATPPANPATRLVEAFVHGEDIRRPLGIDAEYPNDAVRIAIGYQLKTSVSMGGGRQRATGLRLIDEDGFTWGDGVDVQGRAIDLLLALSGRPAQLSGDGVPKLVSD